MMTFLERSSPIMMKTIFKVRKYFTKHHPSYLFLNGYMHLNTHINQWRTPFSLCVTDFFSITKNIIYHIKWSQILFFSFDNQKVQTTVVKSNLNPVWNEDLMLSVPQDYGVVKLVMFHPKPFPFRNMIVLSFLLFLILNTIVKSYFLR